MWIITSGLQFDNDADPLLAKNLFNMEGQNWKEMRSKLSPTFTSGRMKTMFPLVLKCAETLDKYLGTMADTGTFVDVKVQQDRCFLQLQPLGPCIDLIHYHLH
jgi:cytochrome P450